MNREEQLTIIKRACHVAHGNDSGEADPMQPFGLCDVLLAIGESLNEVDYGYGPRQVNEIGINADGWFVGLGTLDGAGIDAKWNLRADNLTEQSDECILFLYGLFK